MSESNNVRPRRVPRGALLFVLAWLLFFGGPVAAWFVGPAGLLLMVAAPVLAFAAYCRADNPKLRRTMRVAELVVLMGCLFLAWVAFAPSIDVMMHRPHEAKDRMNCQEHLRGIWEACRQYRSDFGVLPDRLGRLRVEHVRDFGDFLCPASEDVPGQTAKIGAWSSYEYDPDGTEWVLRDKNPEWHIPGGRNVVRPDGKVEFVKEPRAAGATEAVSGVESPHTRTTSTDEGGSAP